MTQNYTKWSTTPANNTATPPDGAPAGMLPSQSEGVWREIMAEIAILGNAVSTNGYIWAGSTGGTTTAYTATIAPVLGSFDLADGLTFRARMNAANGGAPTMALNGLAAKPIWKLTGAAPAIVRTGDLAATAVVDFTYDSTLGAAGAWIAKIPFIPWNHIAGLTLSNNGGTPNTKVDVQPGQATDSTNAGVMEFHTTALTVDFGGTNGAGALDTGAIAASKAYAILLIAGTTGVSVMATLETAGSAIAPTMPSGYTLYRYIGSVLTDGSSHILPFTQVGSVFYLATQVEDVKVSNLGTSAVLYTLTVPLSVKIEPLTRSSVSNNSVIFTSPDETDVAPVVNFSSAPGADPTVAQIRLLTNSSGQIRVRAAGTNTSLNIVTRGWIDPHVASRF